MLAAAVVCAVTSFVSPLRSAAWAAGTDPGGPFALTILSSRPDMASGGEGLFLARVPDQLPPGHVSIRSDGRDVTSAFHPVGAGELLGRLTGLHPGRNTVQLYADERSGGNPQSSLVVTNYPRTGPVFSGPHEHPYVCETGQSGLGPPADADCSAPTIYRFFYKSTADGQFHPFDTASAAPSDLAMTTTSDGRTVPYIVRVEEGTINRAVYQIAVLFDLDRPWQPWEPQEGWNGRLVYAFGGGCGAGYHQGHTSPDAAPNLEFIGDVPISEGYAVATATLNVLGTNCNAVTAAETMMMVKSHFITWYGDPRWTVGWGASGGGIQQYMIAGSYPGLLDGIIPGWSFPDYLTPMHSAYDCQLLGHYLSIHPDSPLAGDSAALAAVTGFDTYGTCTPMTAGLGILVDPVRGCDPVIPPALIYNPVTNPLGARCTLRDHNKNILGWYPQTGFARPWYDNVGVQYGLGALNAGMISPDEFVDLNAAIGGYGLDGQFTASRSAADPVALRNAYRSGLELGGGPGLASIPILDARMYTDTEANLHTSYNSYLTRQRLLQSNGTAANQVIWETATSTPLWTAVDTNAFHTMARWLNAIAADTAPLPQAAKVLRDKPAGLADSCFLDPADPGAATPGPCPQALPVHKDPLLAAGAPPADNVLKCQLKPLDHRDYHVSFTAQQWQRLTAAFPTGVCDYSKPGVQQQPPAGTWQVYPNW